MRSVTRATALLCALAGATAFDPVRLRQGVVDAPSRTSPPWRFAGPSGVTTPPTMRFAAAREDDAPPVKSDDVQALATDAPVVTGDTTSGAPSQEVNLDHTIEWVDTTPPAWMLAEAHLCRGVSAVTGDESVRPVFKFTYGGGASPPEGKSGTVNVLELRGPGQVLYFPDQMVAVPREECEFSASQEAYSSTSSYMRSMAMNMGLSLEVSSFGGFSASTEASSVEHGMKSGENEMFQARAQCLLATVRLSDDSALHPDFAARLLAWTQAHQAVATAAEAEKAVAEGKARDLAFKLFEDYGTHFYTQSDFGGELISRKFVNKESVATSKESNLKVGFGGSAAVAPGVALAASTDVSTSSSSESASSSSSSSETIIAHGGQPGSFSEEAGADLAWGTWAQTLPLFSVPLNKKLKPISKLVKRLPELAQSDKTTVRRPLQDALFKHILKYIAGNAVPRQTEYVVLAVYARAEQEETGIASNEQAQDPKQDLTLSEPPQGEALPDLSKDETFPVLDVYGSNGDIKGWKLGSNSMLRNFAYGQAMAFSRDVPSIGSVDSMRLVMPANTEFRLFKVLDLASGDAFVFDTRPSARLTEDPLTQKDPTKWVWESKPLRFSRARVLPVGEGEDLVPVDKTTFTPAEAAIESLLSLDDSNRYEVTVETSMAKMINAPGVVSVTLYGEFGSIGIRASLFQQKWWSLIGQQSKVEASHDREKLLVASRSAGFLNFPISDSDPITPRYSVITKEGRDIGAVTHVEVSLAADAAVGVPPYALRKDEQRRLAIALCKQLTKAYEGGPSESCEGRTSALEEAFGVASVSTEDCKRVRLLMQQDEAPLKCVWDESKRTYRKFDAKDKARGECVTYKSVGDSGDGSTCTELFPDNADYDFFTQENSDPKSRFIAVKRVFVHDVGQGSVRVADFGGERIAAGMGEKKMLL